MPCCSNPLVRSKCKIRSPSRISTFAELIFPSLESQVSTRLPPLALRFAETPASEIGVLWTTLCSCHIATNSPRDEAHTANSHSLEEWRS